jgi:prophage antirepressor-like protein
MTTEQAQEHLSANELSKIFDYENKKIRIVGTVDEPWFCGKDIAEILGYENTTKAIRDNVEIEDRTPYSSIFRVGTGETNLEHTNKNDLKTVYINESGVYSLVLRSKLESAKSFKKWITKIVLPSIRKNGYFVSDRILPEKVKQLEAELEAKNKAMEETANILKEKDKIIATEKHKNIKYSEYLKKSQELKKAEIFYIATTQQYAKNNRFKYGGIENTNLLKSRLAGYNTGRAEGDNMYFAKILMCNNYRQIESRLESLTKIFKDKQDSKKEMLEMRYDHLEKLVDFIAENSDKETDYINEHCSRILDDMMNIDVVVPIALDINDFIATPKKVEKINISNWTEEQRRDVLIQLLSDLAVDKNIINFDYKTTPLEIKWPDLIEVIENKYGKNKRLMWKDTVANFIKNTKIIIGGIKGKK